MAQQLSLRDLQELRSANLLENDEIAFKEGDVLIAEKIGTKQRRVINIGNLLLEANRTVLHD